MKYYLDAIKKYAVVSGRASRKDYWMFGLLDTLVAFIIAMVQIILGMEGEFLSSLYSLALVCPRFCLHIRRLHDVDKCGWWFLLIFVPFAGFYAAYLLWFKRGTAGINSYGAPTGGAAYASPAEPIYGAYSVPVQNEFSGYQMCPTPVRQPKHCAYCGTALEPNARFCTECGAPVGK